MAAVKPGFPARRQKPWQTQVLECSYAPRIPTPFQAARMPPSTSGTDARRYNRRLRAVAAAILGCRRAGLPSPAAETMANPDAGMFQRPANSHAVPGGKDAVLCVRHRCPTLRPAHPRCSGSHPWLPQSRASQPGGKNRGQPHAQECSCAPRISAQSQAARTPSAHSK